MSIGLLAAGSVSLSILLLRNGDSSLDPTKPLGKDKSDRANLGAPKPPPMFADFIGQSQIRFTYRNGEEANHYSILESLGGGVAILDYNEDGNQDVMLAGGGGFGDGQTIHGLPNALFRNLGDGSFEEITEFAGLAQPLFYSHGLAAADFDNDGWSDLLVTGYGRVALYLNLGDGTFREVTIDAGLTDTGWSTSAAWGDLNQDGNLDLYIAHYVNWSFQNHPQCFSEGRPDVCSPRKFGPTKDSVYFNQGDGSFADATVHAGLVLENAKGLGVILLDVDGDRKLDIYVANDTTDNHLYRNQGAGRFEEVGRIFGVALDNDGVPNGSMGIDVSDVNNDGWPDILVTNFARESQALYRNQSGRGFVHVSQLAGLMAVGRSFVSFGVGFLDFDRDGAEDIFIANGHVVHHPTDSTVKQRPLLFRSNGQGRFLPVSASDAGSYFESTHLARGAAVGDLDNDGLIDICISHTNDSCAVLRNNSAHAGHYLKVILRGKSSARTPVGAVATLEVAGKRLVRFQKGGGSYLSQHESSLFFGLGETDRVERLVVQWPSLRETALLNLPIDRPLVVTEE